MAAAAAASAGRVEEVEAEAADEGEANGEEEDDDGGEAASEEAAAGAAAAAGAEAAVVPEARANASSLAFCSRAFLLSKTAARDSTVESARAAGGGSGEKRGRAGEERARVAARRTAESCCLRFFPHPHEKSRLGKEVEMNDEDDLSTNI